MAGRSGRTVRWVVGGVAVLVVLAVGGPFVYIHFVEGPAPAKLTLPTDQTGSSPTTATRTTATQPTATKSTATKTTATKTTATKTTTTTAAAASAAPIDGTWKVGSGSIVGYRVQETLIGQQSTAVGRTTKVWGSLTISGDSVTKGTFTADMATVVSDQSERNRQFDGRIMDVSDYPTATFKITSPIKVSPVPAGGSVKQFTATGDLTMHGVTKPISFSVSAERSGSTIYVLADIRVVFANWGISNPSIGGFVTTRTFGTLEVLLHLTKGTGNPVTAAGSGNSGPGGGGGGPVTVPSTTVPALTVPTG